MPDVSTAKVMIESLCPLVATVFQPILENDISSYINNTTRVLHLNAFTKRCYEDNMFCNKLVCLHILLQDQIFQYL